MQSYPPGHWIEDFKKIEMRFVDHEWKMVGEPTTGNFEQMNEDAEAEAPQESACQ